MNIKQALKIYKQRIGHTSRIWDEEFAEATKLLMDNRICTNCGKKMVTGYDTFLRKRSGYILKCSNKRCPLSNVRLMIG